MEGTPHPIPRTVEEVFSDFKGRRSGLIKALTSGLFLIFIFLAKFTFLCFISVFSLLVFVCFLN
jgi:hypothetical protein